MYNKKKRKEERGKTATRFYILILHHDIDVDSRRERRLLSARSGTRREEENRDEARFTSFDEHG